MYQNFVVNSISQPLCITFSNVLYLWSCSQDVKIVYFPQIYQSEVAVLASWTKSSVEQVKYEFPQHFVKATLWILRVPNQTLKSWVVTVKFGWMTFFYLFFLSVMWQPSTVTGSCNFPSTAAAPLISLLLLLLKTDTCWTWKTVSVASYFCIALLHCLWYICIWNYVIASVFKLLTNVCGLFCSSQLTENTAGVVEVSLLEIRVEFGLSLAGLLYFGLETPALVPSPTPPTPIQFVNSKRNIQELG